MEDGRTNHAYETKWRLVLLVSYHYNTRKYSASEFYGHLNIDHDATQTHINSAFSNHQLNISFVPEKNERLVASLRITLFPL